MSVAEATEILEARKGYLASVRAATKAAEAALAEARELERSAENVVASAERAVAVERGREWLAVHPEHADLVRAGRSDKTYAALVRAGFATRHTQRTNGGSRYYTWAMTRRWHDVAAALASAPAKESP